MPQQKNGIIKSEMKIRDHCPAINQHETPAKPIKTP